MSSSTPSHWSKDYVEHLRTVHFALIGLSLGLILIVITAKSYSPNVALREIEQILELRKTWSSQPIEDHGVNHKWLTTDGKNITGYEDVEQFLRHVKIPRYGPQFTAEVIIGAPKHASRRVFVFPDTNHFPVVPGTKWPLNSFPDTLSDFANWWDSLPRGEYIPVYLAPTVSSFDFHNSIGFPSRMMLPSPNVTHQKVPTVLLQFYQDDTKNEAYYAGADVVADGGWHYKLPVEIMSYVEVNQETLEQRFFGWQKSAFNVTFADLAQAAQGLESLDLDRIREIVSDDAAKGNQVFEAFGMKFPAEQISVWGVFLVLAVQIYLFTYLRQLSGKLRLDDPGWDVPWVGMDESALAQFIFFGTLALFPVASLCLLGGFSVRQSWMTHWHWAGYFHIVAGPIVNPSLFIILKLAIWLAVVLASLYLAMRSWKYRPLATDRAATNEPTVS